MSADLIWTFVGFFLTILVLSYVLGDNPLFRLTTYIFVGVSAAYAAIQLVYLVLLPKLVNPLLVAPLPEKLLLLVPAILSVLLLFKLIPRFSIIGSPSMAFLVGAGAAVAIGGAITGTIIGQFNGAVSAFDLSGSTSGLAAGGQLLGGVILLAGTVSSLAYFHFSAKKQPNQSIRRPFWMEIISKAGELFIAITLGALFAGVLAAALTALIERIQFLISVIRLLIS